MTRDLGGSSSLLTGTRQTMTTWTRVIESYNEIPRVYQDAFRASLRDHQPFPHVVLAPALTGVPHKTTEKLIYEANDTLYVLVRAETGIVTQAYPLDKVCDIEIGRIFLYSWLNIHGMTRKGLVTSTKIEFNSSSTRHFTDFIAKMRPQPNGADDTDLKRERAALDYLADESYKFMNYAKNSLVKGEKVLYTLWQPEIRESVFPLIHLPFYRTIEPAHLTIVTDKELILIREEESGKGRGKESRYGGIWQYIPLRSVASLSLEELADNRLLFSIGLSLPGYVYRRFELSQHPEVVRLQNMIKKLTRASVT